MKVRLNANAQSSSALRGKDAGVAALHSMHHPRYPREKN